MIDAAERANSPTNFNRLADGRCGTRHDGAMNIEPGAVRSLLHRPAFGLPEGASAVIFQTRELYASPNGDRWYLGRDAQSGRMFGAT